MQACQAANALNIMNYVICIDQINIIHLKYWLKVLLSNVFVEEKAFYKHVITYIIQISTVGTF